MGFFKILFEAVKKILNSDRENSKPTIEIQRVQRSETQSGEDQPGRNDPTPPDGSPTPASDRKLVITIGPITQLDRAIPHLDGDVQIKNWSPPNLCPNCRTKGKIVRDGSKPNGWRCKVCNFDFT